MYICLINSLYVNKNIANKFVLTLLIIISTVKADFEWVAYINPGIKFGWRLGERPQFLVGLEVSSTVVFDKYAYVWTGVNLGLDYCFRQNKIVHYHEIEGGIPLLGFAVGGEFFDGYNFRCRMFAGLIEYISYKIPGKSPGELAFVTKPPIGIYYKRYPGND